MEEKEKKEREEQKHLEEALTQMTMEENKALEEHTKFELEFEEKKELEEQKHLEETLTQIAS